MKQRFCAPKGLAWEVGASRAFRALLVYTRPCAQAETKLGKASGDSPAIELPPLEAGFINDPTSTESFVLPNG